MKVHYSPSAGGFSVCKARVRPCPLLKDPDAWHGIDEETGALKEYSSIEEAEKDYEKYKEKLSKRDSIGLKKNPLSKELEAIEEKVREYSINSSSFIGYTFPDRHRQALQDSAFILSEVALYEKDLFSPEEILDMRIASISAGHHLRNTGKSSKEDKSATRYDPVFFNKTLEKTLLKHPEAIDRVGAGVYRNEREAESYLENKRPDLLEEYNSYKGLSKRFILEKDTRELEEKTKEIYSDLYLPKIEDNFSETPIGKHQEDLLDSMYLQTRVIGAKNSVLRDMLDKSLSDDKRFREAAPNNTPDNWERLSQKSIGAKVDLPNYSPSGKAYSNSSNQYEVLAKSGNSVIFKRSKDFYGKDFILEFSSPETGSRVRVLSREDLRNLRNNKPLKVKNFTDKGLDKFLEIEQGELF